MPMPVSTTRRPLAGARPPLHPQSAVDGEHRAGHESRPRPRPGSVRSARRPRARPGRAERRGRADASRALSGRHVGQLGRDVAGRDAVDAHAARADLLGERLREDRSARPWRPVVGLSGVAVDADDGAHCHDGTPVAVRSMRRAAAGRRGTHRRGSLRSRRRSPAVLMRAIRLSRVMPALRTERVDLAELVLAASDAAASCLLGYRDVASATRAPARGFDRSRPRPRCRRRRAVVDADRRRPPAASSSAQAARPMPREAPVISANAPISSAQRPAPAARAMSSGPETETDGRLLSIRRIRPEHGARADLDRTCAPRGRAARRRPA